ncbi:Asp23/Gls24 family envelope stress response protein [Nocardioides okcheonensis]|uniref:Asp23/Gls24 family envelope stress response protein n=1 Tax=Nocardioides okcheonensis TaxID=2894081 RepID=UPI001E2D4C27|nr:Asp23/Gls24 family envelope stress response protein [Nocardioides okcheonensis]UFN45779.1 alkaline shock response membrane anchor protein AmaP [Nocardioides okcheonensis]
MSDLVATDAPVALAEPEARGQLHVRAHALRHIVEAAAREVPGVRPTDSSLAGVRSGTPHANVTVRGATARVDLEVACAWPAPVSTIAARVRDQVLARAAELSGVRIASVDVTVTVAGTDDRRTS